MTTTSLRRLNLCTTWSGVLITFAGIVVSIIEGGSWIGNGIALFGVLVTCVGNVASAKLERQQESELAADKERIDELVYRVEDAEERLNGPSIQEVMLAYADAHQDDGR
jgi:hypothetical protein